MKLLHGKIVFMVTAAGVLALAGCGASPSGDPVPGTPPLSSPAPTPAPASEPNWFSRTADATWNAMQAPVRWVTPKPVPKKPVAPAGPLYEPSEAIIVPHGAAGQVPVLIPERAEPTSTPAHRP